MSAPATPRSSAGKKRCVHCNQALELDRNNWRTYNNRAAVFVGLKQFDLAMTDVNAGLELAPQFGHTAARAAKS